MKFGKLTQSELSNIELSLPQDHPTNKKIFKAGAKTNVYVGCAKWGRKEWLGLIYPLKTKDGLFLDHYVKHFNGIELNSTFYGVKKTQIEKWAAKASPGFKFCPKFVQWISHIKRLKDAEYLTDDFLSAIEPFGDHLGTCFLQMPDNFTPKSFDALHHYLNGLPHDFPVAVELRHTDWFTDPVVFNETFDMLTVLNKGAVITDTAGRRDCLHQRLTIPTTFIRFNGYGLHATDFKRMDEWAFRIKTWLIGGIENIHFYVHQENEADSPKTCDYMVKKLNEVCGLNLKPPQFLTEQPGLWD